MKQAREEFDQDVATIRQAARVARAPFVDIRTGFEFAANVSKALADSPIAATSVAIRGWCDALSRAFREGDRDGIKLAWESLEKELP